MRNFILQIFTWWNGQTLGLRFHTWRRGEHVGTDEGGNRYYRTRGGLKDPRLGFERRWVVYAGEAEASTIPPGWWSWMHHRTDELPGAYVPREWQKPHRPNLTGTAAAYRPAGSILAEEPRPVGRDYEAWTPRS